MNVVIPIIEETKATRLAGFLKELAVISALYPDVVAGYNLMTKDEIKKESYERSQRKN